MKGEWLFMNYRMGAIQSPADHRDFIYSSIKATAALPKSFFLNKLPIKDQGDFGACVGFASSTVKDKQEHKNHPGRGIKTSPAFIYAECKKLDGVPNEEGTYPRVAMKVLLEKGTCLESTVPYSDEVMKKSMPSTTHAYEEAKKFKVGAYAKVQTTAEIKQALVQDGAVLAGVIVTDSFLKPQNGFIPMPEGSFLGGHAICLDGYDDDLTFAYKNGRTYKGFFRVVNSWGEDWGDKGYGYLPYAFVDFRSDIGMAFFSEAWTSIDVIMPNPAAQKITLWVDKTIAMVDGEKVVLEQAPSISPQSGRTLIPVRFIAENFDCQVDWDPVERRIDITRRG